MTLNIYGLCIHGLMGDIYSNSMNGLAFRLNRETPAGVHFTVIGGNDPRLVQPMIEQGIDGAIAGGATVILIGHSLGADMVVDECDRLNEKGVKVPIAGVVDPVDWTGTHRPGIWEIDANVGLVINPYQDAYPGGGHVVRAGGNTVTEVRLMHMPQYPHAAVVGYDIGSCPETQSALTEAVLAYVKLAGYA